MNSTEDILNRHLEAFSEQDLDMMLSTYADDAVLLNEEHAFRGREEIAGEFERLFSEFSGVDMSENGRILTKTEGQYAYIVWCAETPDKIYEYVTATFVISEGEIQFQTMAGKITPK
jgi:ketosteroid isomerase-like protein